MNMRWRRVLIGSAVAIMLLGLGVLEIAADRVGVEQALPKASDSAYGQTGASWREFFNMQGHLLSLELGPPADWDTAEPQLRAEGESQIHGDQGDGVIK